MNILKEEEKNVLAKSIEKRKLINGIAFCVQMKTLDKFFLLITFSENIFLSL